MESMRFVINENIYMPFVLKEEATPVYKNAETTNKVNIDAIMNYLRYKRIDEWNEQDIASMLEKTIKEITEQEG